MRMLVLHCVEADSQTENESVVRETLFAHDHDHRGQFFLFQLLKNKNKKLDSASFFV